MKRIYISGPMSGIAEHNFPAFNRAALILRGLNFEVVNPAEINPDSTKTWHECLREDVKQLCDCDTLALLEGWEHSQGAHLELHIAHRLGMTITTVERIINER